MKNFDEIYNELEKEDELKNIWLEAKRKQVKIKINALIIAIIINIILIILFNKDILIMAGFIFLIIVLNSDVLITVKYLCEFKMDKYKAKFKKNIIEILMKNVYTDLEYFPYKKMPERIYNQASYKEMHNKYFSDDYIEIIMDNKYYIEMAEVKTQKEIETEDEDGNRRVIQTIDIFHGLFERITLEKSINAELRIETNHNENSNDKKLEMDFGEFEKNFNVYTSNKILGMQILTADVMEKLIEFKKKLQIQYDVTILNNAIYIRFRCGSMFEPNNFRKKVLDKKTLEKYFYMLKFTYDLTNEFIKIINETEI